VVGACLGVGCFGKAGRRLQKMHCAAGPSQPASPTDLPASHLSRPPSRRPPGTILSASAKPLQGSEAHSRKSALSLLALAATGAVCSRGINGGQRQGNVQLSVCLQVGQDGRLAGGQGWEGKDEFHLAA
jgi:hypothetical protein